MKEMALRSRIAVLIIAALLSVTGTLGTTAFLTADDAQAQPYPGPCVKFYYQGQLHTYCG